MKPADPPTSESESEMEIEVRPAADSPVPSASPFPEADRSSRGSYAAAARSLPPATPSQRPATAAALSAKQPARIPPIFVDTMERFTVHARALKTILGKNVDIRAAGKGARIYADTASEYRHVQEYLRSKKVEFHTFALAADREIKVAIRGLANSITADEVNEELTDRGFSLTYVTKLGGRTRDYSNAFLVCLKNLPNSRQIYEITQLLFCNRVKVEAFKSKVAVPQCYSCQRFGHSSVNCGFTPRCVRCAANHPASECRKSKEVPAKCVNCQGDHPANYRKCPAYQAEVRKRSGRKAPLLDAAPASSAAPATARSANLPEYESSSEEEQPADGWQATRRRKRRRGGRRRPAKLQRSQAPTAAQDGEETLTPPSTRDQLPATVPSASVLVPTAIAKKEQVPNRPLSETLTPAPVSEVLPSTSRRERVEPDASGPSTSQAVPVLVPRQNAKSAKRSDAPAVKGTERKQKPTPATGFTLDVPKILRWISDIYQAYLAGQSIVGLVMAAVGDILANYG